MVKKEKIAIGRLDGMRNDLLHANKKIRIGFVGGGANSFIGYTHRLAARFDNRFEFVAGVFSKNIKKSKDFGVSLGLDSKRCYADYLSMAKEEGKKLDGIQALGIMTPSGDHYRIAKPFINNNVHIICDKPLTATVEDALKLEKLVNLGFLTRAIKTKRYSMNKALDKRSRGVLFRESFSFTIKNFSEYVAIIINSLIHNKL